MKTISELIGVGARRLVRISFCGMPALLWGGLFAIFDPTIGGMCAIAGFWLGWQCTEAKPERGESDNAQDDGSPTEIKLCPKKILTAHPKTPPTGSVVGIVVYRLVVPLDYARWWNRGYQRYRNNDRHMERMPSAAIAFTRRCERVREKSLAAERRSRQLHRERFPEFVRHNADVRDRPA